MPGSTLRDSVIIDLGSVGGDGRGTVERFIAMNRGINDGGDLPEELLRVSSALLQGHALRRC